MGLAFIFKSVINLKLFFMCSVREGLSVLFCFACKVTQLFQHHFWKYFHFPIVLVWHFCWKSNVHLNIWLFLDSSFCSTDLCVCAFAYHTALITIALQVLKSGSLNLLNWFFFKIVLGRVGPIILIVHLKIIIGYFTLLGGTAGTGKKYSLYMNTFLK